MVAAADNDPNGYRAMLATVQKLAGYQALCLHQAFRLLVEGEGDPDLMPLKLRKLICRTLAENGYRERFMLPIGSNEGGLMWVRDAWPIDDGALCDVEVESFNLF